MIFEMAYWLTIMANGLETRIYPKGSRVKILKRIKISNSSFRDFSIDQKESENQGHATLGYILRALRIKYYIFFDIHCPGSQG